MKQSTRFGIRLACAIVLAATALPLSLSFVVSPEDIESGRVTLTPPCPSRALLARPCLGCGLSRGFSALSHGRLRDALAYNRGAPFAYAATWLVAAASAVGLTFATRSVSVRPDSPPVPISIEENR